MLNSELTILNEIESINQAQSQVLMKRWLRERSVWWQFIRTGFIRKITLVISIPREFVDLLLWLLVM